jgi:hypothetical protein
MEEDSKEGQKWKMTIEMTAYVHPGRANTEIPHLLLGKHLRL